MSTLAHHIHKLGNRSENQVHIDYKVGDDRPRYTNTIGDGTRKISDPNSDVGDVQIVLYRTLPGDILCCGSRRSERQPPTAAGRHR